MQVYVAFAISDLDRVRLGLRAHYEKYHYNAGRGTFFVATRGETTKQVASKLGLGDGNEHGTTGGIVVPVTSYWGRHSNDLWEWIDTMQATNGLP